MPTVLKKYSLYWSSFIQKYCIYTISKLFWAWEHRCPFWPGMLSLPHQVTSVQHTCACQMWASCTGNIASIRGTPLDVMACDISIIGAQFADSMIPISKNTKNNKLQHDNEWLAYTNPAMAVTVWIICLTHWGWDKMAANFLMTFSKAFLEWKCMKISVQLILWVQLTIFHWLI